MTYAIINEVNQYLRVFNTDHETFLVGSWEDDAPFQIVRSRESAEKVLILLKRNPIVDWDGNGKEPIIIEIKEY